MVEVEASAVVEAIKWIEQLGLHNVDIESHSLITVHAINKASDNYLEVGALFQECSSFLRERRDISLSFVKKQANKVAHIVASEPCEVNFFIEFTTPPHSMLEQLVRDILID